jgi:hypothetical protein
MAFTDGIDVSNPAVALATSNCVSLGGQAVFSLGTQYEYHAVDFATGNCLGSLGGNVYSTGINVGYVGAQFGVDLVEAPYLPSVFTASIRISNYYSRLLKPGDTGIDISFLNLKPQLFGKIFNIF